MFENLLKVKIWNRATEEKFYEALSDYFDEDKCAYTNDVAKKLMKNGNEHSAENILLYAIQNYNKLDDKNDSAILYYTLGELYEKHYCNYQKAYECYREYGLLNTKFGGVPSLLVRALLLKDNFTYSDELEKELLRSYGEGDLGLRNDRFYETAANYLVAEHDGKTDLCEKYKKEIKGIVKADEIFVLDLFMKKDTVRDVLEIPAIAKAFIKSFDKTEVAE